MSDFIKDYFTGLLVSLLLGLIAPPLSAQQIARAEKSGNAATGAAVQFKYHFENQRFTTPVQEVTFDGQGKGEYRFKKKDQDEIVLNFNVSSSVLSQMGNLFDEMNFLASTEDYQHKKDFSHLGTVTITHSRGGKERSVKINYTENQSLSRLIDIFRNIATQENRIFELETIRTNDPISMPAQLRQLESELKGKRIAEPERFASMLEEIKLDESVPLIARNHSDRLLQLIKKGK